MEKSAIKKCLQVVGFKAQMLKLNGFFGKKMSKMAALNCTITYCVVQKKLLFVK